MSDWPELSVERDHETLAILHLASQMLGKIRVVHAPWMNHGWHVALQPNARGLSALPTAASGGRTFTLTLDLCRHASVLWVSDESREELPLNAGSIAPGFTLASTCTWCCVEAASEMTSTMLANVGSGRTPLNGVLRLLPRDSREPR